MLYVNQTLRSCFACYSAVVLLGVVVASSVIDNIHAEIPLGFLMWVMILSHPRSLHSQWIVGGGFVVSVVLLQIETDIIDSLIMAVPGILWYCCELRSIRSAGSFTSPNWLDNYIGFLVHIAAVFICMEAVKFSMEKLLSFVWHVGSPREIVCWALFSVSLFNITHNVIPLAIDLGLSLSRL